MGTLVCTAWVRSTGEPASATTSARSSSLASWSASQSWSRQRLRKAASVDHDVSSKARRAAPMAASRSSRVASALCPITSSVAGFTFANVAPELDPTSLPSMSRRASGRSGGRGIGSSPRPELGR
jgi:hypothetical protein